MKLKVLTLFLIGCCFTLPGWGQVGMLSKGNWVKIAVPNEGVYQLTGAQFKAMGFTGREEGLVATATCLLMAKS